MMLGVRTLIILILGLLFFPPSLFASTDSPIGANPQMSEWVDWVLHGNDLYGCPAQYAQYTKKSCAWPSTLSLKLSEQGGEFKQQWIIFKESRVSLPGSDKRWPQNVTANNKTVEVTGRGPQPSVLLKPGSYLIKGHFNWSQLPEVLQIPSTTGLTTISVNNKILARPDITNDGRVWLKDTGKKTEQGVTDSLQTKVFRRIIDDIPMQVETLLKINVSGKSREVFLKPLLPGLIPLTLTSTLPARLENDGRLRVQVRPGQWSIRLLGRYPGPIHKLALPKDSKTPEIWAFDARNQLRLVEVQGVDSIDPRQTTLPGEWRHLPIYLLHPNQTMRFKEIRRGDPNPQPDKLNLVRNLWLDFDGQGYNFKDNIQGSMTRDWRISAGAGVILGNVSIDGRPQFVTHLPGNDMIHGVEVRRGQLNLDAESRYTQSRSRLPVAGWDKDFASARATLHIPPGYKVFSISGTDNAPPTWVQQWTLLDLFLVLVITISILRLWSWPWALIALLTMAITWHQAGAPQGLWFAILLGAALHKVIRHEKYRQWIGIYLAVNFVLLVLMTLPFAVQQLRVAIYPQLEHHWRNIQPISQSPHETKQVEAARAAAAPQKTEGRVSKRYKSMLSDEAYRVDSHLMARKAKQALVEIDPKASIQTGYGTPQWRWQRLDLRWNGPVDKVQTMNITYIPPWLNRLLGFLRVIALIALGLFLIKHSGVMSLRLNKLKRSGGSTAASLLLLALIPLATLITDRQALAGEFPPKALLKELKSRLLEAPKCRNQCAEYSRMALAIAGNRLTIRLEAHADNQTAIPLPAHQHQWMPDIVTVDGKKTPPMASSNGQLWVVVDPGVHQILLSGNTGALSQFQLTMPLKPHYATAKVKGWVLDGLHENGQLDSTLQFSRKSKQGQSKLQALEPSQLPPFLRIERTLQLGLDWTVTTEVLRLNNPDSAIVAKIPLLSGESVNTNQVRVTDGNVLVNLAAGVNRYRWTSTLAKTKLLTLKAAETTTFTEVWKGLFGPTWHIVTRGIPVIHHIQSSGSWLPEWHPWPGEQVSIEVSKPIGVEGPTVTIDQSQRRIKPGQRVTDTQLTLTIRSSKGTQQPIKLPDGAILQSVSIDGTPQPIRQAGREVNLPLHPGKQTITLEWRVERGIGLAFSPGRVELGLPTINDSTNIHLGRGRWVLWLRGPVMGPAVLFWGVLIVVIILAYGLGRLPITPLKAWQWALLCIGLTQVSLWVGVVIVGWLLVLGLRGRLESKPEVVTFNLMQVGLALWSLLALVSLYQAVAHGLLGFPDMQVSGNNSYAYDLNWFQDRSEGRLPNITVISASLMTYRLVMLAWALWLAFNLIKWMQWGWACVAHHGLWHTKKPADIKPELK